MLFNRWDKLIAMNNFTTLRSWTILFCNLFAANGWHCIGDFGVQDPGSRLLRALIYISGMLIRDETLRLRLRRFEINFTLGLDFPPCPDARSRSLAPGRPAA